MDDSSVLLDTNVLLSATAPARALHANALRVLNEWPNHGVPLCTSGQILCEYLVVATRPSALNGLELRMADALENVDSMRARMRLLEETRRVLGRLRSLLDEVTCTGKQIHDANVVATALGHGVRRVLTDNTGDFERYSPWLEVLPLDQV